MFSSRAFGSTMPTPCRIVVLISGSGSNLQALLDAAAAGEINAEIVGVISNRADAFGLERAARAGVATEVVDHRQFDDRASFDRALASHIDALEPDLVILAGFMRILTDAFVHHYQGRLLNIHPSLLPKYPGLDTHRRAIEAGDAEAGATVHFVTAELDGGPAVLHGRVPVQPGDTAATLAERVLEVEHQIYPRAVGWFASGRLQLRPDGAWLDDILLPPGGKCLSDC
jgi:phosphoribosylglycinamide formyltransferase-1